MPQVDTIALCQPVAVAIISISESIRRCAAMLPVLIDHATERIEADVLIAAASRASAEEREVNIRLRMASSHDGAQAQVIVTLKCAGRIRQRREPTDASIQADGVVVCYHITARIRRTRQPRMIRSARHFRIRVLHLPQC